MGIEHNNTKKSSKQRAESENLFAIAKNSFLETRWLVVCLSR